MVNLKKKRKLFVSTAIRRVNVPGIHRTSAEIQADHVLMQAIHISKSVKEKKDTCFRYSSNILGPTTDSPLNPKYVESLPHH